MYFVLFDGDLIHGNIIVMAKLEGKDVESLKNLLISRKFLELLRRSEYLSFWYNLISKIDIDLEIEFIDDEISDESFETILSYLEDVKLDIFPLLTSYDKSQHNCIAIIEDDILLDIIRKCSNILIDYDYPTLYF